MQENLTNKFSPSFIINFWNRVKKTKSCWIWKGGKRTSFGYGEARLNKRKVMAHRISFLIKNGNIPHNMYVLHRCDNPPCVNPDHLFLGTYKTNKEDSMNKMRHAFGEKNTHVLMESQVKEIRKIYVPYKFGILKLSKAYKCSMGAIQSILHRRTWKHI